MAALAVAAILISGCTDLDGADPYALWETCEHPDGAFHFHYPEPPFEKAAGFDATAPVLLLDPGQSFEEEPNPSARILLEARLDQIDGVLAWFEWRSAIWTERGYDLEAPMIRHNGAGDEGLLLVGRSGVLSVLEIAYPDEASVVAMTIWGEWETGGSDLWLLVDGFEPRGAKGSE